MFMNFKAIHGYVQITSQVNIISLFVSYWDLNQNIIAVYLPQIKMSDLAPWRKADIIYTRWRHQMEIFSALLALCEGNSPVTGNFPSQRPVTLMFSLISAWTNGWAYHWDAGDLRLHRAHSDVFIMKWILNILRLNCKGGIWFIYSLKQKYHLHELIRVTWKVSYLTIIPLLVR